jgi:hypothetical protein
MTEYDKKTISYVPYSEDTKDFLLISLIDYSDKSFALAINYLNNLTKDKLNKEQKEQMEEVKKFFGKSDDPEFESLNGMGNTKLKDGDGTLFFGYIYAKGSGQKALKWFAQRAAELPSREDLEKKKLPKGLEKDTQEYENYLNDYSSKTEEELFEMLGVKETKAASKYTKKPVYTTDGPKFNKSQGESSSSKSKSSSSPKALIKGLPTSTKAKRPTIKECLEIILDAIEEGDIDEDFTYEKEYDPKDDEEKRIGYVTMKDLKTVRTNFKEKYDVKTLSSLGSLKCEVLTKPFDE